MTSDELAKIDNFIFFIMQSCEVPDVEKSSHIKIRIMFRTKNSNIKTYFFVIKINIKVSSLSSL